MVPILDTAALPVERRRARRLETPVVVAGHGLHSGRAARVKIAPAPRGAGLELVRADRRERPRIRVDLDAVACAERRVVLASPDRSARVSTVEHLLSALAGLGIRDAELAVEGEEVPILDGSALPFARALALASVEDDHVAPAAGGWRVARAFAMRRGAAACHLLPAEAGVLELECGVELAGLGRQLIRFRAGSAERYLERVAPARTFGFLGEAERLRRAGLARGASLSCALVLDGAGGVVNPAGTRFSDEPVRHKLLDAIGDLALLGVPLAGRLRLERCSHALLIATLGRARAEGAIVLDGR